MKKSDKYFYFILLFFVILLSISLFLILNQSSKGKSISLPALKPSGVFIIEAPDQVDYSKSFRVQVIADTKGKNINAVALNLSFNSEKLSVVNMDTSSSFCQFYPENRFNNEAGTISIQCGAPSPGFKGKSNIVSLELLPKSIGQANLEISPESMILLNDGTGKNIFSQPISHTINILNSI